ncbi:MAG: hypothetical protein DI551_09200 [Micavibrio aeruginosavorus]|uniref:Phage tail assembly chaperone-like domain-containing protein n=1 Tax=Micavibrio aeruginosavorus TaxID=349221 RepID=A0A2W5PJW5_9BACT|nr:MAG: hypothetical protein DI551_09200 [Micavibrio aeruginosavorus]
MSKKFAVFNGNGFPIAFYSEDIHRAYTLDGELITDIVPPEAVEISHQQWLEFINHPDERKWENGQIEVCELALPSPDWNDIRSIRDNLLRKSDWTQLPDSPLSLDQKQAWVTYRQALRDITEDYEFSSEVVWPEQPE